MPGGPSRRSHTKSRKGCRTCKRRHVKCDETFPQCRNCTKHNCRCDYMDSPAMDLSNPGSQSPNLLLTPEIEGEINAWQSTGSFSFPQLSFLDFPLKQYSAIDLRLIHHITTISVRMHQQGYSRCTVWAHRMFSFLKIASTNDFVMSSLLALSATHLAWLTRSPETDNLAYHHRGVALKGLQEAIGNFSRSNADAILAASLVLSWQANDWRGCTLLMQGISTVIAAMQPWKDESELAECMEEQTMLGGLPPPSSPPNSAEVMRLHADAYASLDRIGMSLQSIRQNFPFTDEQNMQISSLVDFMQSLRTVLPLQSPEQTFEYLQPLRAWLFWLAPTLLTNPSMTIGPLTMIANNSAMALALDPLLPSGMGAFLASMCASPILETYHILHSNLASNPTRHDYQVAVNLVQYPYEVVNQFWSKVEWNRANKPHSWCGDFSLFQIRSPSTEPKEEEAASSVSHPSEVDQYFGQDRRSLSVPISPFTLQSNETSSRRTSMYSVPSARVSPLLPAQCLASSSDLLDGPDAFSSPLITESPDYMYEVPSIGYTGGFVASIPWA